MLALAPSSADSYLLTNMKADGIVDQQNTFNRKPSQ